MMGYVCHMMSNVKKAEGAATLATAALFALVESSARRFEDGRPNESKGVSHSPTGECPIELN